MNDWKPIAESLNSSLDHLMRYTYPFQYWMIQNCLPEKVVDELIDLPIDEPQVLYEEGTREANNATRSYFNFKNRVAFSVCESVATAFQVKMITDKISQMFGIDLRQSYLRIEYCQDTDGFWLEPHTDIGVKRFTMSLYLSKDPSHVGLGTSIYNSNKEHLTDVQFEPNTALVFIPGNDTWHGFEKREIKGVRTSLIINYVEPTWNDTEQLCFPNTPIK